jgi:ATP-dependent DNA helicase DinG
VLVVNHHLLFADVAARREAAMYGSTVVLPPYRRVIIDEAHKAENSATSFFTGQFSGPALFRQLSRLFRRRGVRESGLLVRLAALLPAVELDGGRERDWQTEIERLHEAAEELNRQALQLCGEGVFRLVPEREALITERLLPPLELVRRLILRFTGKAALLIEGVEGNTSDNSPANDIVWELRSALRRLQKFSGICARVIEYRDHPLEAIWIERRHSTGADGKDWAWFNTAPVSIAEQLKEALFEANKTVVCVSATLTVSGSFKYWMTRTGIDRAREADGRAKTVLNGSFPSPFPYESTVLTAAPADAPDPNGRDFQNFVNEAVFRLAESSGGAALVLFTSFESLYAAYNSAAPRLEALGLRCLKQGGDDRSRLLRAFIDDESSVLFAADSFWEGVDAPGDALRLVIMCRLPFKSPSDPVFEARAENLERQGGNSFMELSVPEAVMKFRQGFGRDRKSVV